MERDLETVLGGFARLIASQLVVRCLSFGLNVLSARALTPAAYGVVAVQLHLLNSGLLFLSREGLRRATLRLHIDGGDVDGAGGGRTAVDDGGRGRGAETAADGGGSGTALVEPGEAPSALSPPSSAAKVGRARARVMATSLLCLPAGLVLSAAAISLLLSHSRSSGRWTGPLMLQGAAVMVELASEPFYNLAGCEGRFGVRAAAEGAATVAKAAAALVGVTQLGLGDAAGPSGPAADLASSEDLGTASLAALAFSWAQLVYALVLALVFVLDEGRRRWAASRGLGATLAVAAPAPRAAAPRSSAAPSALLHGPTLRLAWIFSVQALQKLVLAEGGKAALAAMATSNDQGVFGLVSALAGLAARVLFQPAEEAAFVGFSKMAGKEGSADAGPGSKVGSQGDDPADGERDGKIAGEASDGASPASPRPARASAAEYRFLCVVSRTTTLIASFAAAFAPALSFLAVRLLYGPGWAATGAPALLACAAAQLFLLAANGAAEAYVHATAGGAALRRANRVLLLVALSKVALSVPLVRSLGGAGMLAADSVDAAVRLAYNLRYIQGRAPPGTRPSRDLYPRRPTLVALAASALSLALLRAVLLPESSLVAWAILPPFRHRLPFTLRAALLVAAAAVALAVSLRAATRAEHDVLAAALRTWRGKSD